MALGMFTGSGSAYDPRLDIRPEFGSRGSGSPGWAAHGVKTLLGTGVRGPHIWDGQPHWEAVQSSKHLDITWDGSALGFARVPVGPYCTVTAPHMGITYYMCPTEAYTESRVREILSHLQPQHIGIELDEPEFWSRGGYGEGFKEEWRAFYHEEWQDPESSAEARYKASQLMAHLLQRFVRRIFQAVRAVNPQAFCMVNPHSPFSYAEAFTTRSMAGDIISTIGEVAFIEEADAVLAEVWSDTIKAALVCRGAPTIEPFLHSWVDRSLFENLGRGSGKRIFQLLDPKSDDPKFPWASYRAWFEEDTLAALMVGGDNFWVAWTDRIMLMDQPPAGPAPEEYRTVFNTVMNVCRDAEHHPYRSQSRIGVPVSDTIMWQRDVPGKNYIDAFYALTLPLLDQGVELEVLPLECGPRPGFLDDFKVLLTSFDFWNPQRPEMVNALADWVRGGGTLLYFGTSEFDDVPSAWWRQAGHPSSFAALFDRLGLSTPLAQAVPLQALEVASDLIRDLGSRFLAEPMPSPPGWWQVGSLLSSGFFVQPHLWTAQVAGASTLLNTTEGQPVAWELPVGRGRVIWAGLSPWFMAWGLEGPIFLRAMTALACSRAGVPYAPKPALDVRRGPYRLVYAFADYTLPGDFLDLLHHELRIEHSPELRARQYHMLYDLSAASAGPGLIYSGAVSSGLEVQGRKLRVSLEGPQGSLLATALRLPAAPRRVSATDAEDASELLFGSAYDSAEGILRLRHRSPRTRASLVVEW
jgi:hypothetical protein